MPAPDIIDNHNSSPKDVLRTAVQCSGFVDYHELRAMSCAQKGEGTAPVAKVKKPQV